MISFIIPQNGKLVKKEVFQAASTPTKRGHQPGAGAAKSPRPVESAPFPFLAYPPV